MEFGWETVKCGICVWKTINFAKFYNISILFDFFFFFEPRLGVPSPKLNHSTCANIPTQTESFNVIFICFHRTFTGSRKSHVLLQGNTTSNSHSSPFLNRLNRSNEASLGGKACSQSCFIFAAGVGGGAPPQSSRGRK